MQTRVYRSACLPYLEALHVQPVRSAMWHHINRLRGRKYRVPFGIADVITGL